MGLKASCTVFHTLTTLIFEILYVSPQTKISLLCILLYPSPTPAQQTLTLFPWSGENSSSLSPILFGVSVICSYNLVIQLWHHATGEAFLITLMLRMKTSLVTSGFSKVGQKTEGNMNTPSLPVYFKSIIFWTKKYVCVVCWKYLKNGWNGETVVVQNTNTEIRSPLKVGAIIMGKRFTLQKAQFGMWHFFPILYFIKTHLLCLWG